jgi:hypothetical protein
MFAATILSISAGRGGISLIKDSMKAALFIVSPGFQRFSKPMVEEGLPDNPAPQTLPA